MIAVCVIIAAICTLAIALRVWSPRSRGRLDFGTLFAFDREQRRLRITHDESVVPGQEMVTRSTANATDGGSNDDDLLDVDTKGRWQALVYRFSRFPMPRLVRTRSPGDDRVPLVRGPNVAEDRDEDVTETGSVFDCETWNRPEEIQNQDL